MPNAHWLVKSEPSKYSYARLVDEGRTRWDGVRNYEARNRLRAMSAGDLLLFYHSNEGKEIVGVARVVREAYPDPTAPGEDWSAVDVEPVASLARPVTLDTIRRTPELASIEFLRRNRLSVTSVAPAEFATVLRLSGTPVATGARLVGPAHEKTTTKGTAKRAPGERAPRPRTAKITDAKPSG